VKKTQATARTFIRTYHTKKFMRKNAAKCLMAAQAVSKDQACLVNANQSFGHYRTTDTTRLFV